MKTHSASKLVAVLIIALAVTTSAFCAGYKVVRVIDGDTIKVTKDEKVVTVVNYNNKPEVYHF